MQTIFAFFTGYTHPPNLFSFAICDASFFFFFLNSVVSSVGRFLLQQRHPPVSERSLIGLKLYDCVIIEFQKMPFHHHLYIYYIDIPAS
jgi:hypothetical protein